MVYHICMSWANKAVKIHFYPVSENSSAIFGWAAFGLPATPAFQIIHHVVSPTISHPLLQACLCMCIVCVCMFLYRIHVLQGIADCFLKLCLPHPLGCVLLKVAVKKKGTAQLTIYRFTDHPRSGWIFLGTSCSLEQCAMSYPFVVEKRSGYLGITTSLTLSPAIIDFNMNTSMVSGI